MNDWATEIDRLVQTGQVSDADVRALRDLVWTNESIERPTLDDLFLINDSCAPESTDWQGFFIEAIEHFLLRQKFPHGYIHENDAAWLRSQIQTNGTIGSHSELELLVRIVEEAENAPDDFRQFAMREIERSILSGAGATRTDDCEIRPACIDPHEVRLLRRLIFAGGSEATIIVGSAEAEMLLRLKNATMGNANAPEWADLFVQGVGNHLLAHSNYRPLSREEAERLNREMNGNTPNVASFFRRMIPGEMFGKGTLVEAFKAIFPARPLPDALQDGSAASALTAQEANWLKAHIIADSETDDLEKALLAFIIDEVGNLPPALEAVRRRA